MHIGSMISKSLVVVSSVLFIISRGSGFLALYLALVLSVSWVIALLATMLLYGSYGWGGLDVGVKD
jgi:ABC-type sulfate transport system permease subunit